MKNKVGLLWDAVLQFPAAGVSLGETLCIEDAVGIRSLLLTQSTRDDGVRY